MIPRLVFTLLTVVSIVGCAEEPPAIVPEDRMQRTVFADADREAITEPAYAEFREAVRQVRTLESKRPTLIESDPESVDAYAAFIGQLEVANRTAAATITADGWTRDQRRLMQRTLRFASRDDLAE